MNPLTLVKRIQKINSKEADLGISDEASWHAKYKGSAYVFVGGVPYDLTEGDLLAVFAQYGEIVDVNLVRDKGTGKSKGFAFIAYEDQRSTNLAVDNLNGAQILGRVIRVDHVSDYKKKQEEDEEEERKKREARGVCRAFQKGECTRGAGCKFSHDEQRAADTGWGGPQEDKEDRGSRWGNDKFDDRVKLDNRSSQHERNPDSRATERRQDDDYHGRHSKGSVRTDNHRQIGEIKSTDDYRRDRQTLAKEKTDRKEDHDRHANERRSSRYDREANAGEDRDRREEKRPRRHEMETDQRGHHNERDRERERDREKNSSHARNSSSQHHRDQ
ncbi:hypothetical protein Droror1_Dr00019154 [Drosera rotundifolia]